MTEPLGNSRHGISSAPSPAHQPSATRIAMRDQQHLLASRPLLTGWDDVQALSMPARRWLSAAWTLRIDRRYHRFMRSKASGLFPIFRSVAQSEILGAMLPYPDREQTISDLSQQLAIPLATVSDEVSRLVRAELFNTRKVGRSNLLKPNTANRLLAPLTEIVLATMGPHRLIREAFAHIDGVTRLLIYGSWAARYRGESGPPPHDLDVLLVGTPNRAEVYEAAEAVERRIGLPVNPVIASATRWADDGDPLMSQIKSSPTVYVDTTNRTS